VVGHNVAMAIKYGKLSLKQACDFIVNSENKNIKGDMGIIALNTQGEIAIEFNSDLMHRAWVGLDRVVHIKIYT
jgi:beta-aspartyl-peptidase (threonine type)